MKERYLTVTFFNSEGSVKKCIIQCYQVLEEDVLVIVAGASHAERLANAISNWHGNVADLTLPGWRLTEDTAEDLASDICGILKNNTPSKTILIMQVFDNSAFMGKIGEEVCHPVKMDGKYHIPGKLVTVGGSVIFFITLFFIIIFL